MPATLKESEAVLEAADMLLSLGASRANHGHPM